MIKTLSVAALIAATSTAAFAGSLAPYEETKVEDQGVFVPATGSGIGAPAIIGGVVAAVAIAALVANDDDSDSTTETPED